ncbi:hypothetical protein PV325_011330, partial [Microctonus aethiopoides]
LTVRNGRTQGDQEGRITYVGGGDIYRGSVLDMIIEVDRGEGEGITKLEVTTRTESDHLPVRYEVKRKEEGRKERGYRKERGRKGEEKIKWEKDKESQYATEVLRRIREVREDEERGERGWETIKRVMWEAANEIKIVKAEKAGAGRDDMEEEWERKGEGGTVIGKQKIKVLKYADDIAVVAESAEQLKKMLETLEKYVDKSELMGTGSGESVQIPGVLVHHKEHNRTTHEGGRRKGTKSSKRDVGVNHEGGKRKDERENVFNGDNRKSNSDVRGRDMGEWPGTRQDVMEMEDSRWPKICMKEEMRGILNKTPSKWGKSLCKGWKASWEKRVSEALWKEEEWEEALEKIKEGVEEWWEMEKKREEEKIKRSTFNGAYKEIMPETEEKRATKGVSEKQAKKCMKEIAKAKKKGMQ